MQRFQLVPASLPADPDEFSEVLAAAPMMPFKISKDLIPTISLTINLNEKKFEIPRKIGTLLSLYNIFFLELTSTQCYSIRNQCILHTLGVRAGVRDSCWWFLSDSDHGPDQTAEKERRNQGVSGKL